MEVNWKTKADISPILFLRKVNWSGVCVRHASVLEGELPECKSDTHELNITLAGTLVVEKRSAVGKYVVNKGSVGNLCLTPAGQFYRASWVVPVENLAIEIDPDFLKQTALENKFSYNFEFPEIYRSEDPLIQQIGIALLEEPNSETNTGRLYADSLVQTLSLHLLKNYSSAGSVKQNLNGGLSGFKLRRVKEFINDKLEDDLSLAELAAVADLSQYHFARAFRRTIGITPQHYLMQQRIERAKELLANNDLPIVEISLRTGFKNQSHFTTLFRKFTKLTPKTWRELKHA